MSNDNKNGDMAHVKNHARDGHGVKSYDRGPVGQGLGIIRTNSGSFNVKIDGIVSENSCQFPKDAATVKDALNRFGYYEYPAFVTDRAKADWMDRQVGPAIRKFQADHELPVNGRIRPDGNTIFKMNEIAEHINEMVERIPTYNIMKTFAEALNQKKDFEAEEKRTKTSYNDKYKHAKISCDGAQNGSIGAATIAVMGAGKEATQIVTGANTFRESSGDMKANVYGINKGMSNPKGNCDEMVQEKYPKYNNKK